MSKRLIAQEINRALQIFAMGLGLPDEQKMEIADLYPAWQVNKAYAVGDVVKFGTNADGETQLYSVVQAHTSQADWLPDALPALYKAIGYTDDGIAIWTQPLGSEDAYAIGDEVSHKGMLWVSLAESNIWEPGIYGWLEKM